VGGGSRWQEQELQLANEILREGPGREGNGTTDTSVINRWWPHTITVKLSRLQGLDEQCQMEQLRRRCQMEEMVTTGECGTARREYTTFCSRI
jgi:hypothetical protein